MRRAIAATVCSVCVFLIAAMARGEVTGARVAEDQVRETIHVNGGAANASDENPESEARPVKAVVVIPAVTALLP